MINNKHLGGEWIAPAEFAEVQHRDFATAAHMEAICGNAGHIGQCQPLLDYSCKDVLLNPQTPCWPTPPSCLIKPDNTTQKPSGRQQHSWGFHSYYQVKPTLGSVFQLQDRKLICQGKANLLQDCNLPHFDILLDNSCHEFSNTIQ